MIKKYDLKLKGFVGGWDFDSDYVDYVLERKEKGEVNVLINSLGGDVATAFTVSALFKNHANVNVHYVGMNASAATIASLGAKHISIDANAMYLVHKCSNLVLKWDFFNADQLQQLIDECEKQKRDLEKIDLNIASAYAARCKKDKAQLLDLMKEGGWLSAKEALEWGFVDEITDEPEDEAPVLDEGVVNFMANAGIPLPKGVKVEKPGLLQRLLDAVTGAKLVNKTTTVMKKTFAFLCALLAVEAFTSQDGKITLADDEVQKIEDEMARLNDLYKKSQDDVASRDTTINELNARIAELEKKPAEAPTNVIEDGKKSEQNDFTARFNQAKEMFNQINH